MDWVPVISLPWAIGFGLLSSYALYFLFGRTDELGKNATQNTFASVATIAINFFLMLYFVGDVNRFMQSTYDALGIPKLSAEFWADVPFLLVCVIGLIAHDFAIFISHRIMHTKWGWATHAAHHSDTHVNAFTLYRVHFLEVMLMQLCTVVILTWMQMPDAIPIVVSFMVLHGMYVHMDLDFDHGPFKYVLTSPVFHRWHHADVPEAYGKNLANIVPVFDLMFGTFYDPGPCNEKMGALKSGVEDKNPISILTYPFREWARLIGAEYAKWSNRRVATRGVLLSKKREEGL